MERRLPWLAALLLSLLVAGGCSKVEDATDEDNGSEGADGGSGDGDGDGDGDDGSSGDGDGDGDDGSSGDGDGDGDDSSSGDGDGDSPADDDGAQFIDAGMGIVCGGAVCDPNACCADEFASICGAPLGEKACVMPPPMDATSDERCPELSLGGFFNLPSCCTDNNECGLNAAMFGAGCIENGRFAELAAQMSGGMVSDVAFPEPKACDE